MFMNTKIKQYLKVDKNEGVLYGFLLIIPFGIPLIILIKIFKEFKKKRNIKQ